MGEGTSKKIEEIAVGDGVRSFAGGKIVNSSMSQIYKAQRDYYYELSAQEYIVRVTAERNS